MEYITRFYIILATAVLVQCDPLECDEIKLHQNSENCTLTKLNDVLSLKIPIHFLPRQTHTKKHLICLNSDPIFFPAIIFQTYRRAEKFTAKNCQIRSILQHSFSSATYLRELNMPHNSLQQLADQHIFKGARQLERINLSYNLIFFINPNVFNSIRYLSYLDLQHNKLQNLNIMLRISQPMELIASHNQITTFGVQHDKYIPRNMDLLIDARWNKISRLQIPTNIPVKQLLLDHNHIKNVSSVVRFKRLTLLSILHNPIFAVDFTRELYTRHTSVPSNKLFVQTKNDGIKPVNHHPSNCTGGFEKEYCLNRGFCYNFVIDHAITLLMCECSHGYFGERCEEKFLEGTYRSRLRYYG